MAAWCGVRPRASSRTCWSVSTRSCDGLLLGLEQRRLPLPRQVLERLCVRQLPVELGPLRRGQVREIGHERDPTNATAVASPRRPSSLPPKNLLARAYTSFATGTATMLPHSVH